MKNALKTAASFSLVLLAAATTAHANPPVPEIDTASGAAALTLIAGATMILRSRKR